MHVPAAHWPTVRPPLVWAMQILAGQDAPPSPPPLQTPTQAHKHTHTHTASVDVNANFIVLPFVYFHCPHPTCGCVVVSVCGRLLLPVASGCGLRRAGQLPCPVALFARLPCPALPSLARAAPSLRSPHAALVGSPAASVVHRRGLPALSPLSCYPPLSPPPPPAYTHAHARRPMQTCCWV